MRFFRTCLVAVAFILCSASVFADTITDIRIDGAQRIETETVLSYLTLKKGDDFSADAIDESLKALFDTGFFSDVAFFQDGGALIVKVVENPIISEIAFEGNDKVKESELQAETQLRPRVVYTRAAVQQDVQRMLQIYRRLGNYGATIDPKIIELDQNRVNLVYEIREGDKTKVRSVKFVGNIAYGEGTLRSVISTKEHRWYRFLSSDDNYDQDRIAYDEELLRKFYLSKGYADFTVQSSVAELTPDQKEFFITYSISEGQRYRLGDVKIDSQLRNAKIDLLKPLLRTLSGDWYNADLVDSTILALTDGLANQQFAFVEIRPQVELDREKRRVNLSYVINESPRVFVERIDIINNTRTLDEVVRREMLLVEGDPFNRNKLKRSEQLIRDLGFFSDVRVKTIPGSRPDLAIIEVTLAEQSTGELSVGAGFSTADGPLGDFRIRERNLLGKGQDLQVAATISGRTNQYDLRFTEPYFLDRQLMAGFDVFHRTTDFQDISSFDQTRTGGTLRMGYPLAENLRQDLRLRFSDSTIENINADASRYVRDQAGNWVTIETGHTISYTTLDSRINPTEGWNNTLSNDYAGFGGDASYVATKVTSAYYKPLSDDRNWIFSPSAEAGYIIGLNNNVRIDERYYLGMNNFRGFDLAGIGARDITTGDALGGNRYVKGSLELTTPVGNATKNLGIRSHFFTDVGTLGQVDDTGSEIADEESIRLSVGFGLSWQSPLGPLRGDLAYPIMKEEYDEDRIFNFNFGTRF